MSEEILLSTDFKDLKLYKRGKVRDIYDLEDKLLIVATDRISCFDLVLPSAIPYKGDVLTQISLFWFEFTKDIVGNHLVSGVPCRYDKKLSQYEDILRMRSMLVKKTKVLPIECVVRGYLSGSGWKEYKNNNSICGIKLPPGLRESEKLPYIIFTPATKIDCGHDINVSQEDVGKKLGLKLTQRIKDISINLYKKASRFTWSKGIIIADTKFEFGLLDDEVILIDEVLTPDSSRFWSKDGYEPGKNQASFDKQFVRDYLESIAWRKVPPAPNLPDEIIKKTSEKYLDIFKKITGKDLLEL